MSVIKCTCFLSSLCTFRLQAPAEIEVNSKRLVLSNKVKYTKCIKVRKRLPRCSVMLHMLVMYRNDVTHQ